MSRFFFIISMLGFSLLPALAAGEESLLLVPFQSIGVDSIPLQTAYRLLEQELDNARHWRVVVPDADSVERMSVARNALIRLGRDWQCDKVVSVQFNRLEEKIIVSYRYLDVRTDSIILADQAIALNADDFDVIMHRIAQSIIVRKQFSRSAELGSITEGETREIRTRQALLYGGVDFGYLYPQSGFDGDMSRSFSLDFISTYENHGHLIYGLLGIRKGFIMNLGYTYMLAGGKDFSPYLGGGVGFHWIGHNSWDDTKQEEITGRGDGFEIMAKTGMMLFRTYNFRVLINLDLAYTMNDFDDQSIVLTIGLLHAGTRFLGIF